MPKNLLPLIAVFVLLTVIAAALKLALSKGGRKATGAVAGKLPLTEREQAMYFRLKECFPDCVVLAQVAFSALMTSKDRPTRATFDRKVADFVLCTKGFKVLCVIELDDSTHRGKEAKDKSRDELLQRAGVKTVRFPQIPDAEQLLAAVLPPAKPAA